MKKLKAKILTLPAQIRFIKSENKYPFFVGGYGSGKSQALTMRTIDLLKRRDGKGLVLVGAPTYALVRDVNVIDFEEYLSHYKIPYKYKRTENKIKLTGTIKGEVWFRSYDKPEKWVGFEATDAILDEFDIIKINKQKELWVKVLARLRKCNDATCGITTTPEGFKYTYELAVVRGIGELIQAKTPDNVFLPEDYIDSLYEQYDELLVKQYINGEFVNINGHSAYYSFSRENLIDEYKQHNGEIFIGMDFNIDPMTCVIAQMNKDKLIVFDELYLKNCNTERMCEKIKELYPDRDIVVCPDMTGIKRTTSATVGYTDIKILQKHGFRIKGKRNPFVRDRLNTVNNALSKNNVVILDTLTRLIRDLEQVVLTEYGEIDKSNMDLTHISDAFGYLVFKQLPYTSNKWVI